MDKRFHRMVSVSLASMGAILLAACAAQAAPTQALAEEPAEDAAPDDSTEEPMEEVTNAVEVADQELGEGSTVVVPGVTADVAGWMVIHAAGEDGPGPVIGYAPVPAGQSSDVAVELDPEGITDTLYAMLHVDAGTEGEYEFPGDDVPARDAEGNVVVRPFTVMAAVANAVEVADQPLGEGGTVTVPGVSAAVPGWMVIHAAGESGPGPVIGHAPVPAGESTDVVVEIDTAGLTDTLFAMLHVDAGTKGEYEFPGDDVPARDAEDNVVVKPFALTGNAVGVSDQPLVDGTLVTVQSILADVPGWIVIHADNEGAPGPILGFAPVDAGFSRDVSVEIDGEAATETLYAMLHVDAGTAGEFEFPGGDDVPARDAADNVVTPPFNLVDASVEVADQELSEENTVVVPTVEAETAGWLVIHADNEGAPGPIIGYVAIPAGVSKNVAVEIDPAGATETVYAMLHVDAGTVGEFEFPGGDDLPARDDEDNVVVKPFALAGIEMMDAEMADEAVTIMVGDNRFDPGELTVASGTTVTWCYSGSSGHTVTSDDGLFSSGNMGSGDCFSFTFNDPGTYAYHCDYHGGAGGRGMSGVVNVTGS